MNWDCSNYEILVWPSLRVLKPGLIRLFFSSGIIFFSHKFLQHSFKPSRFLQNSDKQTVPIYVKANKFHMSKIVAMGDNVHSEITSRITTHACMLACTKRTSPY